MDPYVHFCLPMHSVTTDLIKFGSHKTESNHLSEYSEMEFKRAIIIIPSFLSSHFSVSLNSLSRGYCVNLAGIENTLGLPLDSLSGKEHHQQAPSSSK